MRSSAAGLRSGPATLGGAGVGSARGGDTPGGRLTEAENSVEQCGLAGTVGTDDAVEAPLLNAQVELFQDLLMLDRHVEVRDANRQRF